MSVVAIATRFIDLNAPLRFADGWDKRIVAHVSSQSEPIRIVSLASHLRKCVQHHKESLKREILARIGALIRVGSFYRVRRKDVIPGRA
jgi:hypothetical protein